MNLLALTRPSFMPRLAAVAPWTWAPDRRRRVALWWLRVLGVALAALLSTWVVLWLAVPPLLKSQAEQRFSAWLGRTVTIGAVQFSPWSLQLTLRDVTIAVAPSAGAGNAPLLHVARFYADADWRSLIRLAPVIESLQVDAPQVNLARTAAGHYDIDDIIERLKPTPREGAEAKPPARFALYNLQVRDGAIRFDDRPVARQHKVDALLLTLPFVSSLPSQVDITVEPRLAFTFDRTPFDTGAQATPFARDHETALTLRMGEFDLTIAKPYLPHDLPVQLQRGRAQADLSVNFVLREDKTPSVSLRGSVKVSDLALADRAGAPLAAWHVLQVALADVEPLQRKVTLADVHFDGLDVALSRDALGHINLLQLAMAPQIADVPQPPSGPARPTALPAPWRVKVRSLEFTGARVRWNDALTQPAAALSLDSIDGAVGPVNWPANEPATLALKAQLHAAGKDATPAVIDVKGSVTPSKANLALRVDDLDLAAFEPYLASLLRPRVEGRGALDATVDWAKDPAVLTLNLKSASVDALRISDVQGTPRERDKKRRAAVSWKRLEVADMKLDAAERKLAIGQIGLHEPQVALERAQDGSINVTRWLVDRAPAGALASPMHAAASGATTGAQTAWQVTLAQLVVDGGQVSWRDEAVAGSTATDPVQLDISALRAAVSGLSWPAASVQAQVQLAAQVADPAASPEQRRARGGTIDWKGRVTAAPLAVRGMLRVERFPLHALERYAGGGINASVQRALAQWRGEVAVRQRPGGIETKLAGDLLLADLHIFPKDPVTRAIEQDELLGWQALSLKGLKVATAPQTRVRVDIDEAVLSDFFSQLVVTEEGRFNVRDVAAPKGAASAPPGGFAVGRQIAPDKPSEAASATQGAAPAEPAMAAASAPRADKLPVEVSVGGLQLVNGRVNYTDRLIKPNFSAALSELNGRLGAFRSDSREMATLELHGRIASTGLLDIQGSLNPMADPLALDVGAKATELELAPLSPYAGKYAGYAIERGKLSMDLHYNVQPDGRLEARNHVVLNQLTFGERIESPSATKLPVRLAVALLSDRHGVIDVNLPISGSINDPQFSVGGIIWQVIVNLIVKVVTSPFALFSGGGGPDLSSVGFQAGTSAMTDGSQAALDKVVQALQDRPTLQMTVTGAADPLSEGDAMRQALLEQRLATQQRNEVVRAGAAASAPEALSPEERERMVRAVYRDTDLPDKPRNVIGLAQDIPVPQMEALLKKNLRVSEDTARQLALQRGLAVRDALVGKGLPSERLFLAAPKLHASGEGDAEWSPRAELSLAVK